MWFLPDLPTSSCIYFFLFNFSLLSIDFLCSSSTVSANTFLCSLIMARISAYPCNCADYVHCCCTQVFWSLLLVWDESKKEMCVSIRQLLSICFFISCYGTNFASALCISNLSICVTLVLFPELSNYDQMHAHFKNLWNISIMS